MNFNSDSHFIQVTLWGQCFLSAFEPYFRTSIVTMEGSELLEVRDYLKRFAGGAIELVFTVFGLVVRLAIEESKSYCGLAVLASHCSQLEPVLGSFFFLDTSLLGLLTFANHDGAGVGVYSVLSVFVGGGLSIGPLEILLGNPKCNKDEKYEESYESCCVHVDSKKDGAQEGNRTLTTLADQQILSLRRLPASATRAFNKKKEL